MTEERRRGIIKTLAIAALYFIFILIADRCNGQSKQFQFESVCVKKYCEHITGTIAITSREIFIINGEVKTTYKILHYFRYKGEYHYRLKGEEFNGWFIMDRRSARMELYGFVINYILIK